ncbi:2-hydroxyacyl-CoA dehydratase subunit D, partial [Thermodesulfobacteriota bacterium]
MTAFETMRKHYQQRDLAAREWKEEGGEVVGYLCDSVPEELILAAGFFPLRLSGDPWGGTETADGYGDGTLSTQGREDFVASMVDMILTGRYDFLDFLIIPRTRDSIQGICSLLDIVKAADPALKLPESHFTDSLYPTSYSNQLYNRDRIIEMKEKLEEWSGKEINNDFLSRAIAIGNENKMLLKEVADLRTADPPRISGVEALQIIGSSMFMLKEEHNRLLSQYLEDTGKLPKRDGVRLFIEGSPLDNLQLYELIELSGATIVTEDNCWGNRYSDVPVDTSIEPPIDAIV